MPQLGFFELVAIFVVALLVFGPKKLPDLGKSLGKGLREFRKATDDLKSNWEEQVREAEHSINDVKQTIHETRAELETTLPDENSHAASDPSTPPSPSNPREEAKPDAHSTREEVKPDAHSS